MNNDRLNMDRFEEEETGFDFKIIFLTFFKGFINKNAY